MSDPGFQPYEYFSFLWGRRHFLFAVPAVALVIALIVSLILPNRYTATATIIIEPPGGSDPRVATAISPIYLDSLKTYEQFASSDSLFARACDKFHLLPQGTMIESFKRRVLRVNKLKETKILQIGVTLRDPKEAQALVQYLAEQTVELNQNVSRDSDADPLESARKQVQDSTATLDRASATWSEIASSGSQTALESEIEALATSESEISQQISSTSALLADYTAREKLLTNKTGEEFAALRQELEGARARIQALQQQRASIAAEIKNKSASSARLGARKEKAEIALKVAQTAHDAAVKRLGEVQAGTGMRAEQLRIIDPGIVPQRPSSPDIPLNCIAALLLGLLASLSVLSVRFAVMGPRTEVQPPKFRIAHRADR